MLRFRVYGLGCNVYGSGGKVQGWEFKCNALVYGFILEIRAEGSGFMF